MTSSPLTNASVARVWRYINSIIIIIIIITVSHDISTANHVTVVSAKCVCGAVMKFPEFLSFYFVKIFVLHVLV